MNIKLNKASNIKPKQQGAVLAVSLVLLILITLLGLSGLRTVNLEEKMVINSIDRNLAFQAAEAALRFGEEYAVANKPTPAYVDANLNTCPTDLTVAINNCTTGVCPEPDNNCGSRWDPASGFTAWANYGGTSLGALAGSVPQYFIEYLGSTYPCNGTVIPDPLNCKRYRVTARSNPSADRASVVLQSLYATD